MNISFYLSVNSDGNDTLLPIQPFLIPVVYYFNCTAAQYPYLEPPQCHMNQSAQTAINTVFCGLTNKLGTKVCPNEVAGWTTPNDALQSHSYNYCPVDQPTCQPNCKAPCSDGYDSCNWDPTQSQFSCTFDPNVLFQGEWWKKPWFIGLVIILFLILVIVIALIVKTVRDR